MFPEEKVSLLELPCHGGQTWVLMLLSLGSNIPPVSPQRCHETHLPDSLGLKVVAKKCGYKIPRD